MGGFSVTPLIRLGSIIYDFPVGTLYPKFWAVYLGVVVIDVALAGLSIVAGVSILKVRPNALRLAKAAEMALTARGGRCSLTPCAGS